jgi:hypothetical protein
VPAPISGPGIGLQLPQYLYPTELSNAPYDASTNRIALGPGEQLPIPAGTWFVGLGFYCVIEFLDPITGGWAQGNSASYVRQAGYVKSDGFNVRVANLTGCPTGAAIVAAGTNYVQASTSISVTGGGGSTWLPVVGGGLGFSSVVTANAGAGYGAPPIVLIPPPPPGANNPNGVGGVPASGYCGIANGTVSGFTFTNSGAGYATAPTPVILPNPTDPNINIGITAATLSFSLVTGGGLTAALCTNPGAPLSNPNNYTLTVSGVGSGASLTGYALQTITAASISGGGTGYGTVSALMTTVGGVPPQGGISTLPGYNRLAWLPRPAQIGLAITGTGTLAAQVGTIYDGGLFNTNATPNYVIVTQPLTATTVAITAATVALTMGGAADFVTLQPAP